MKALGIAATGMLAQQNNVDVIANNIANANTTGYKSGRAAFQDLIYQSVHSAGTLTSDAGTARPVGTDIGLGVQSAGVIRHNTQGGLVQTENQMNLAIDGRGYFIVNRPDGSPVEKLWNCLQIVGMCGQKLTGNHGLPSSFFGSAESPTKKDCEMSYLPVS